MAGILEELTEKERGGIFADACDSEPPSKARRSAIIC